MNALSFAIGDRSRGNGPLQLENWPMKLPFDVYSDAKGEEVDMVSKLSRGKFFNLNTRAIRRL